MYCWKQMAAMLLLGLSLAGTGIAFAEKGRGFVVLLALGCWLCVSIHYPSRYFARQTGKAMGEGEQEFCYRFGENGIEILGRQERNYISYGKIQRIVDAGDSVCFFLGRNAGFLISKSGLEDPAAFGAFVQYLRQHISVPMEKEVPLLLRLFCFRFQRKER